MCINGYMNGTTYIIAGLGNPGKKYEGTRHNVGFHLVDEIASHFGFELSGSKWDARYCRVTLWGKTICFLKPQTYMNLSGKSVARFANFYKTPAHKIIIIHDDIDMGCGRLKLVPGGGSGGHNGIRSVIQCLGSKDFNRLKFGVGRPERLEGGNQMPVNKFVLAPFSKSERDVVQARFEIILKGLKYFVTGDKAAAIQNINSAK